MMHVLIAVTHLLGTGHLARALTLGRAFAQAGDTVTVISGGRAVPHFDTHGLQLVQLPALHTQGTDFTTLLTENGSEADASFHAHRQRVLADAIRQAAPDIVMTELFPFGRRALRTEFETVLQTASALPRRPLILSSIRDILAPPSKPAKAAFADQIVDRFYDGVLVHSDADVVPLDLSWPVSGVLSAKLHYTGFVAQPPAPKGADARDILVSAGGGVVGQRIFEAALEAAALMPSQTWRLLVGGSDARRDALIAAAPPNAWVEAPRADFRSLLHSASASVSMCGYNTALDVLQAGVPAVMVPFDDGGEVEQTLRAKALAELPGVSVLTQGDMSAVSLQTALCDVMSAPRRAARTEGMDGAGRSVAIAHRLLQKMRDDG